MGDFASTDIPIMFNNLQNMVEGEALERSATSINSIKEKIASGQIDPNEKFTLYFPGQIGQKDRTVQEALDFMEEGKGKLRANVDMNFKDLEKLEWRQQWAKQAKIFDEDGLTMSDVATMAGKQILQLPLAYFTYGMSAALQETAGKRSGCR